MIFQLGEFERIVRVSPAPKTPPADGAELSAEDEHPFETRNIHRDIPVLVRKMFDDGYLDRAVFAAFTYLEEEVRAMSKLRGKTGEQLMGAAFGSTPPVIALNAGSTDSELDEQRGFQNLFKGAVAGIRNPAHPNPGCSRGLKPPVSSRLLAM